MDRAIIEHLKFAGYAAGNVRLFRAGDEANGEPAHEAAPEIVLPRSSRYRRGAGAQETED